MSLATHFYLFFVNGLGVNAMRGYYYLLFAIVFFTTSHCLPAMAKNSEPQTTNPLQTSKFMDSKPKKLYNYKIFLKFCKIKKLSYYPV
jgi:hypothetical protein